MFNINENTKIFMVCPPKVKTGGPELAHQLVNLLESKKIDAYIYYIGGGENPVNEDFKKYNDKYIVKLEKKDINKNNILIIPEIYTYLVKKYYKRIQTAIWWMSVDNYSKQIESESSIKKALKKFLNYNQPYNFEKKVETNHLCQSNYAVNFLDKKGIKENIYFLSDYINDTYIRQKIDYEKKENIVLYNPKKGYEFTQKLIEKGEKFRWVPIQNLTTAQVKELLCKSKVYIDFGNHPGKDRFPREAAACGCCVITGKRGSAGYYEDVPIKEEYKFEDIDGNINSIIEKINDCIINYNERIKDFKGYISFIESEKSLFEKDVDNIFQIKG